MKRLKIDQNVSFLFLFFEIIFPLQCSPIHLNVFGEEQKSTQKSWSYRSQGLWRTHCDIFCPLLAQLSPCPACRVCTGISLSLLCQAEVPALPTLAHPGLSWLPTGQEEQRSVLSCRSGCLLCPASHVWELPKSWAPVPALTCWHQQLPGRAPAAYWKQHWIKPATPQVFPCPNSFQKNSVLSSILCKTLSRHSWLCQQLAGQPKAHTVVPHHPCEHICSPLGIGQHLIKADGQRKFKGQD